MFSFSLSSSSQLHPLTSPTVLPSQANLNVSPLLWQPQTGLMMVNEVGEGGSEEAFHCIALSKNDSYVMSASGGKVSLFNMLTFKVNLPRFPLFLQLKGLVYSWLHYSIFLFQLDSVFLLFLVLQLWFHFNSVDG